MNNKRVDFSKFKNSDFKFALYDKEHNAIYGDKLDKKALFIEDKSPLGHLGIWYIVVQNSDFETKKTQIAKKIFLGFVISYLIISIIGFYLAKLFMKPIREARKRLDNFIKDTTHELNTPITAIMMCANEESMKNPKNIQRIYLSAKRLSELYKDLTFLFLEEKRQKREELIVISDVIKEQLKYFEVLSSSKDITIKFVYDDTKVLMDREDLSRLISNILSNAIKYNRVGGDVTVTVKNGLLTISDSGIGIDKSEFKKIFRRYHRATDLSGGFGMGLSIVKKICDDNGIDLEMESTSGKGSSFIFRFSDVR
jgi:two-component system OmpR family sensor kinase